MVLAQLRGWDLTMAFERASQHVFLGVSALFVAASATATIAAGIIDGERRGRGTYVDDQPGSSRRSATAH
jgi:hypothetical protein